MPILLVYVAGLVTTPALVVAACFAVIREDEREQRLIRESRRRSIDTQ